MHDTLYEHQENLDISDLLAYAGSLNLSDKDLESAIKKEMYSEKIKNDFLGGVRSGVNGTPTFFINGFRHNGSFDYENLLDALNNAEK